MTLKTLSIITSFLILFSLNLNATSFSKVATLEPVLMQQGDKKHGVVSVGWILRCFIKLHTLQNFTTQHQDNTALWDV